ncbi:MAG TPA: acyl-CoA dehydrogenase family protein [Acidimicrobiia bacterium]|nr:acyl-CoA dehydrogenase family protein [Acidimicrobiia bacterium]
MRHPVYRDEHDELRETVRRFVAKELRPYVDAWEDEGHFPDDVFRRCGELGFLGLHYPERFGGSGGDLPSGLIFIEELARCGCGAIPMAVSVQTHMATPALAEFGTDAQRDRWLAPAIRGEQICAIAITEPDAGSDVAGLSTRAERSARGWRLTGTKLYITNGLRADWMTVVARTEPGNPHGVSLFCVDTALSGVTRIPLRKLGMRSSDTAEVVLDGVHVDGEALIGETPGLGFKQLMWQLQYERMAAVAACVGHARHVLDETIAFARERRAFGQPIGNFQVIAHGLADCATELEAAVALYDTVLWRLMAGEYPVAEISMAKKWAAQVQNRLIDWCLQVHGGAGFMHEQPVSRAFRDARLQRIGGGTDQVMNEVIAKRLGIMG